MLLNKMARVVLVLIVLSMLLVAAFMQLNLNPHGLASNRVHLVNDMKRKLDAYNAKYHKESDHQLRGVYLIQIIKFSIAIDKLENGDNVDILDLDLSLTE